MTGPPRPPLATRLRTAHWVALDAVVALVLLVFLLTSVPRAVPSALGYTLAVAVTVPLAVRRLWPLPVFGIVLVACAALMVLQRTADNAVAVALAIYPVAAGQSRRTAVGALVLALALFAVGAIPLAGLPGSGAAGGTAVSQGSLTVAVWCVGITVRAQREYTAARLAAAAHAVATQERLRIARELHDVLANGMSLIAVQAGVAGYVLDSRPDEARKALAAIEETSRAGLTELRQMLPALRSRASAPIEVAPGLDDIAALARRTTAAGVAVTVMTRGGPRPVPTGLALSAYRIVQEALTNVVKHARTGTAVVEVEHRGDALVLVVTDGGRGGVPDGSGHGILGMRERVAAYGGTLEAGPVAPPGAGFRVRAELPLPGTRP